MTADVAATVAAHNAGEITVTAPHRPWRLVVSMAFESEAAAASFEGYLSSRRGAAFLKRHVLPGR